MMEFFLFCSLLTNVILLCIVRKQGRRLWQLWQQRAAPRPSPGVTGIVQDVRLALQGEGFTARMSRALTDRVLQVNPGSAASFDSMLRACLQERNAI